jgi:hypothetical protein
MRAVEREGRLDFEAVEKALVQAALQDGAGALQTLLAGVGVGRRAEPVRCTCGAVMDSQGVRSKQLQTLLGLVEFSRSRYGCPRCGMTRYPGDEALDVSGTSRSPGVRRQVARLGAKESFAEVAADLRELAGIEISRKDAERIAETVGEQMETWMAAERLALRLQEPPPPQTPKTLDAFYIEPDGTGVPVVPHEVEGRKGKQANGTAKTREAKVGCVFTQTQTLRDDEGRLRRDDASTSYVAAIESADAFGWRLYAEAVRRGLFEARRVIVLGDGAQWVKNLATLHFPQAQFILDYYHATEHVGDLCRALFDRDLKQVERHRDRWTDCLWEGDVETVIQEARACLPKDPRAKPEARTEIAYFEKNQDFMRYADYRAQGLFIGSGVVEGACKHLIAQRFKQSGMEWTVRGANAIMAARAGIRSGRYEQFWEHRAA